MTELTTGRLTVELADLRGWADQVGRAGGDCEQLAGYVSTFVPDGDFGRLLSLLTPDYEALIARVRDVLEVDGARLAGTQAGLRHVARRYERTDARVADTFGGGVALRDDGRVRAVFGDSGATAPAGPTCGGEVLPEVTFGWLLDQANELVCGLGGPDLRREITDLVAGDVAKAATQASAWGHAGAALAAVRDNLARGSDAVAITWAGAASTSSRAYAGSWVDALSSQSVAMTLVAEHLRDVVDQAVDVAQLVVDAVKEICTLVAAGWTMASIPIYGQVQLVDKVRDAIRLANDARKVLAVFWNFLLVVKDAFVVAADCFTAQALPPAPDTTGSPA